MSLALVSLRDAYSHRLRAFHRALKEFSSSKLTTILDPEYEMKRSMNCGLLVLLVGVFLNGCNGSAEPESNSGEDKLSRFLQEDTFCRDILAKKTVESFLAETPTAKLDVAQSRADIKYAVYMESIFMYQFLDGQLFGIRYVIPRTAFSVREWIQPYQDALGEPSSTTPPDEFRKMGAYEFAQWDLPQHKLRVIFGVLRSRTAGADVDLVGVHLDTDVSREFLNRVSQSSALPVEDRKQIAVTRKATADPELQELLDDAEWGAVAAKINSLCESQISSQEIQSHIFQTIIVARRGQYSPDLVLKLLRSAETEAIQHQLSPVFAVRSTQQSMAFVGTTK